MNTMGVRKKMRTLWKAERKVQLRKMRQRRTKLAQKAAANGEDKKKEKQAA